MSHSFAELALMERSAKRTPLSVGASSGGGGRQIEAKDDNNNNNSRAYSKAAERATNTGTGQAVLLFP